MCTATADPQEEELIFKGSVSKGFNAQCTAITRELIYQLRQCYYDNKHSLIKADIPGSHLNVPKSTRQLQITYKRL
jgi:hypothetical protein